jgi:hypothetical protein
MERRCPAFRCPDSFPRAADLLVLGAHRRLPQEGSPLCPHHRRKLRQRQKARRAGSHFNPGQQEWRALCHCLCQPKVTEA